MNAGVLQPSEHNNGFWGSPLPRVKVGDYGKGNARLKPTRLLDPRAGVSHKQEVGEGRTGRVNTCEM